MDESIQKEWRNWINNEMGDGILNKIFTVRYHGGYIV